jgi:hypothetical protein
MRNKKMINQVQIRIKIVDYNINSHWQLSFVLILIINIYANQSYGGQINESNFIF